MGELYGMWIVSQRDCSTFIPDSKGPKKKIHNNYWCQALFIILEEVKQNTLRKHKKLCVSAQLVTEKQPSGITL